MHLTTPSPNSVVQSLANNTSTDTALTLLAPTSGSFGGGVVINPAGNPAGQVSSDNFVKDIRALPAGGANGSTLLIPEGGGYPQGIKVRRVPGGSNLSNVHFMIW